MIIIYIIMHKKMIVINKRFGSKKIMKLYLLTLTKCESGKMNGKK